MTTVQYALMALAVWRVVRWKNGPRRPAVRRGPDRTPWLVAILSDAVIFGGLAYREHRRKARAGEPTAVRDRRKRTWTRSTPLGGDDRAVRLRPPRRRPDPFDEIPY